MNLTPFEIVAAGLQIEENSGAVLKGSSLAKLELEVKQKD